MTKSLFKKAFLLFMLGSACALAPAFSAESVKIQTFKTHSRIFFSLDPSVEAHLRSNSRGFEILFKGISLSDLGAPLGEETAWANQFAGTGDPRIKDLKFSEVQGGVKVSGTWKFPEGKQALMNPQMQTFDFRQASPSAGYVVDFWVKQGSVTVAEWNAKAKERARQEALRKNEEAKKLRAERRLASEKRKAEIEDTTRFCRETLSEKNDVFLQFYPVHQKVDFKKYLPSTTPDAHLPYYEPKGSEREAQYVRLALKLYREGKVALVLKTLDFFDAEQPQSQHRTQMHFLRANAMIKLGMQHQAEEILANLRVEAKDSPVALHSAMYLAYQQMEAQNWLPATETFLWLSSHFPDYSDAWVFHLGAAEALYAVKQTDRALKEYQWVVERAPDTGSKAEGALRQPDLYMERFEYAQALAAYYQATHYFPEQAKGFVSAYINRAEALYGVGQYDRAKEAFQAFLSDFSGNPNSWRANYRIGEIEARKDGEPAQAEARKWYYETINSAPFSPGATLARLRLLPCGDHGGFDFAATEHFFQKELEHYNPDTEIQLVPFHAMVTLSRVRSLISFGKNAAAVELATAELKKPGNLEMHEMLHSELASIFRKSILDLLALNTDAAKYEALSFYKEKATYLPKGAASPEETDYLLKLSQAASDLGLGSLAKEIADAYAKANSSRAVATSDSPDLASRLVASEQHFTEAKALWVSSGMKEQDSVRAQLAQVIEESKFSYERELILALMDQKSKKPAQALAHAIRAGLLVPSQNAADPSTDLRVQAWSADLQSQAGDAKVALEMYKNLERHIRLQNSSKAQKAVTTKVDEVASSLGIPPMPALDVVLLAQGDLLEKQGRWGEAAGTYARAVEEQIGGNEALYQYARSLRKTGVPANQVKARAVLEKMVAANAGTKDDFWTKLAREALADENTREGGK